MKLIAAGRTDVGNTRCVNEDAILVEPTRGLFAVADGHAGHGSGALAASLLVNSIVLPAEGTIDAGEQLRHALREAAALLTRVAAAVPEFAGTGATSTVLWLTDERAFIAHVGDTRAWRVRDGRAEQLTEDHTLVAKRVRDGLMSPEEAGTSPHRNILLRAICAGDSCPEVDLVLTDARPGDGFLVCSDGLRDAAGACDIASALQRPSREAADRLIDLALARDGHDNVSVVVVRVEAPEPV